MNRLSLTLPNRTNALAPRFAGDPNKPDTEPLIVGYPGKGDTTSLPGGTGTASPTAGLGGGTTPLDKKPIPGSSSPTKYLRTGAKTTPLVGGPFDDAADPDPNITGTFGLTTLTDGNGVDASGLRNGTTQALNLADAETLGLSPEDFADLPADPPPRQVVWVDSNELLKDLISSNKDDQSGIVDILNSMPQVMKPNSTKVAVLKPIDPTSVEYSEQLQPVPSGKNLSNGIPKSMPNSLLVAAGVSVTALLALVLSLFSFGGRESKPAEPVNNPAAASTATNPVLTPNPFETAHAGNTEEQPHSRVLPSVKAPTKGTSSLFTVKKEDGVLSLMQHNQLLGKLRPQDNFVFSSSGQPLGQMTSDGTIFRNGKVSGLLKQKASGTYEILDHIRAGSDLALLSVADMQKQGDSWKITWYQALQSEGGLVRRSPGSKKQVVLPAAELTAEQAATLAYFALKH